MFNLYFLNITSIVILKYWIVKCELVLLRIKNTQEKCFHGEFFFLYMMINKFVLIIYFNIFVLGFCFFQTVQIVF